MTRALLSQSIAALKSYCACEDQGACLRMGHSCDWMQHDPYAHAPVSANEQLSLHALVAYVSHTTGKTEFRVERELADTFRIPNMKFLPAEKYEAAVKYLSEQTSFSPAAKAS